MEQFVVSTVRVSPNAKQRVHLITASTAAAILGIHQDELKRQRENEQSGPWGLTVSCDAYGTVLYVAEDVLALAELWELG